MTNHRKEFLLALFRILERRRVPYCVLRNYASIYDNRSSDVDLIAESKNVIRIREALIDAAAETGHRFVQQARYVNYSYVYWHPDGGFLRVDVDTEIRWRAFPILSATQIIEQRRREGEFFIPHPIQEMVVLLSAAIWRGSLSQRYAQQLGRLYELAGDMELLRRAFLAAFGPAGKNLAATMPAIHRAPLGPEFLKAARTSIMMNAIRSATNCSAFFAHLWGDSVRLWERLRSPAGLSLLFVSGGPVGDVISGLRSYFEILFPADKSVVVQTPQQTGAKASLKHRLLRWKTLFRGGLFVDLREGVDENQISKIIRLDSRCSYPTTAFVCAKTSRGQIFLGHVGSGFMGEVTPKENGSVFQVEMARTLADMLARNLAVQESPPHKRGAWLVMIGLDGSGKTTVARQICCLTATRKQFQAVRYCHWLPGLRRETTLPLPEYRNIQRKPATAQSALRTAASFARLLKNLVLARVAYWLRVRPLMRRNALVLLDRYFYNYYLDPVSVKYYGPTRLLDLARPLFPRPDLIAILQASPEVLLARKQELSRSDIQRQIQLLDQITFDAPKVLRLDASLSPSELAARILQQVS